MPSVSVTSLPAFWISKSSCVPYAVHLINLMSCDLVLAVFLEIHTLASPRFLPKHARMWFVAKDSRFASSPALQMC